MAAPDRPFVIENRILLAAGLVLAAAPQTLMPAQTHQETRGRVLFVLTSHDHVGETGKPTGFYLSEAAHPWAVLVDAGYEVDFVSPKGGPAPVDGFDLDDPINRRFWENPTYRKKIERTRRPTEIDAREYVAIHFAGGHGAMWDLPDDPALATLAARIYEGGGAVSAVCHGPAGLVNVKLSNGKYLVDGKRINAFTNEEEAAVKLERVVPFLLESRLIERGGTFEKSAPWQPHVVTDQRLITGQNPQSAKAVGEALVELLGHRRVIGRLTRYVPPPAGREKFQRALSAYVAEALPQEGNLQAEAYHERDDPSVLWLIERWRSRSDLARFGPTAASRAIESVSGEAPAANARVYWLSDLEPLSKAQWRRPAGAEDTPLTVMLFVDTKAGRQDNFRDVYHRAMPAFRGQPGVVNYQLSQLEDDETKFVTYEKFRSPAAFEAHLKFPPIQPVIDFLQTGIERQPFQAGLHFLIEFAPRARE